MRNNYFILIVPGLLLATFKILFSYGLKGSGLDFLLIFLGLYIVMCLAFVRKLYYNDTGFGLKEISYLILINIFSMIMCYFFIYDSVLFLIYFFKDILILQLLLDTGINIHMADNSTSNPTNTGSSSSTTGTGTGTETGAGNGIPITREENDTLRRYLRDLNWSIENYYYTKSLRDQCIREGNSWWANRCNSHITNTVRIGIERKLNMVTNYKLNLIDNKYERSDRVINHMESLDRHSEDRAIRILDELDE